MHIQEKDKKSHDRKVRLSHPLSIKVHPINSEWILSHPTLFTQRVIKSISCKSQNLSRRRKYVTDLKSMTATNVFLKIYFSKLQLSVWMGIILKFHKSTVVFLLSSEKFTKREKQSEPYYFWSTLEFTIRWGNHLFCLLK